MLEQAALCLQEPAQRAAFEAAKKAEEESTGDAATDRHGFSGRLYTVWALIKYCMFMHIHARQLEYCRWSAVAYLQCCAKHQLRLVDHGLYWPAQQQHVHWRNAQGA